MLRFRLNLCCRPRPPRESSSLWPVASASSWLYCSGRGIGPPTKPPSSPWALFPAQTARAGYELWFCWVQLQQCSCYWRVQVAVRRHDVMRAVQCVADRSLNAHRQTPTGNGNHGDSSAAAAVKVTDLIVTDTDASVHELAHKVRMCLRTGQWLVVWCPFRLGFGRLARMHQALDLPGAYEAEKFHSKAGRIWLCCSASTTTTIPARIALLGVKVAIPNYTSTCPRSVPA